MILDIENQKIFQVYVPILTFTLYSLSLTSSELLLSYSSIRLIVYGDSPILRN